MKKFLIIITFIIICLTTDVKAEYFYEDNYVTGVYATYKKGDFTKSQLMRVIKREGDNLPVYCLTPSDTLYEDELYMARFYSIEKYLNISTEKYKRIKEIAYFGYNYKDHTDLKWYAITQIMLWKEMDEDADIYYANKFKGERIERFQKEEKEIETLIENYNKLPSIENIKMSINDTKEMNIESLNEFNIEADSSLNLKIENNRLIINPKKDGKYKIKLIKKDGNHSHITIPYTANKGQAIMIRGYIDKIEKEIEVEVYSGKLEIKKIDSETLNSLKRGSASVENAKYNLYDKNNNLIETITIGKDGIANVKDLKYGDYILKEVQAPLGYEIDNNIYNIKIDKENTKIELKEDIIKSKLIIKKYLKNDSLKSKEKNIIFEIYDMDNKLVDKITTNINGEAYTNLIYGKYKIVQKNTTFGYKKVNDFYVEIKSNKDKIVNLYDEIIKTKLKILKKDIDTKENILKEASFKIKDLNSNNYINNGEIFKTKNGIIELNIKGGKYLLEEIIPPVGYIKDKNIEFSINSDEEIVLNIYNKKQIGKIKILKYGKLLNNKLIKLSNVKFNLYAKEDILDNNKIIYKKDELIEILTTNNSIAISKDLPIGKYYIKEIETLTGFYIDENIYDIDLNNKQDEQLIIKEIELINKKIVYPKTSNKDIIINTIVIYLIFIGLSLILSGLKHEK